MKLGMSADGVYFYEEPVTIMARRAQVRLSATTAEVLILLARSYGVSIDRFLDEHVTGWLDELRARAAWVEAFAELAPAVPVLGPSFDTPKEEDGSPR
jgi:hypothetical protein